MSSPTISNWVVLWRSRWAGLQSRSHPDLWRICTLEKLDSNCRQGIEWAISCWTEHCQSFARRWPLEPAQRYSSLETTHRQHNRTASRGGRPQALDTTLCRCDYSGSAACLWLNCVCFLSLMLSSPGFFTRPPRLAFFSGGLRSLLVSYCRWIHQSTLMGGSGKAQSRKCVLHNAHWLEYWKALCHGESNSLNAWILGRRVNCTSKFLCGLDWGCFEALIRSYFSNPARRMSK